MAQLCLEGEMEKRSKPERLAKMLTYHYQPPEMKMIEKKIIFNTQNIVKANMTLDQTQANQKS